MKKLTQMITKILDERKEAESVAALSENRIQAYEKPARSGNKIIRGLLIASLLLNILLLFFWLYKMIFEVGCRFSEGRLLGLRPRFSMSFNLLSP